MKSHSSPFRKTSNIVSDGKIQFLVPTKIGRDNIIAELILITKSKLCLKQ